MRIPISSSLSKIATRALLVSLCSARPLSARRLDSRGLDMTLKHIGVDNGLFLGIPGGPMPNYTIAAVEFSPATGDSVDAIVPLVVPSPGKLHV